MFFIASFTALVAGLVLAARHAMAALLPDTGLNGTPGARLLLMGATAVISILVLNRMMSPPAGASLTFSAIMIFAASLMSFAGWYLMQNGVVIAKTVAVLAFLTRVNAQQKSALS